MARIHHTSTQHPGTAATALVIGEALVDIVVDPTGAQTAHPGGSPLNVAVGLGRLGVPTVLATRVGDDPFGTDIRAHLHDAGVALAEQDQPAARTSTATATLAADGSARYEFDVAWDVESIHTVPVPVLHTGSIATVLEPGAAAVEKLLETAPAGTLISVDPNIRPALISSHAEALARIERIARRAHVVKMSDEDLVWLYPDASLDEVAAHYVGLGVALFVITRGADGCSMFSRDWSTTLPAQPTTVADTIGAGDAFMSGLLFGIISSNCGSALREGRTDPLLLERLGQIALRSAALTVSRHGATPPTLRELQGETSRPLAETSAVHGAMSTPF